MRITIDARMMGAANTRGIGRYLEEIIRAMIELNPGNEYDLLERNPHASPFLGHPSVTHVAADVPWYGLAEQFKLPELIRATHPDLLFVPHWNVPIFDRTPRIVFIHDLILLEEPQSVNVTTRGPVVSGLKRLGYRIALRNALTRSKAILVPTDFVKEWIQKRFPNLQTPIVVTGEGMPNSDTSLWQDPNQEHPYFLMVGSAYPHKNHAAVIEAWKVIQERHPGVILKIVGSKDAFMNRLESMVRDSGLTQVEFAGAVSDESLRTLYAESLALIFPSRWEGFGLPPLEALAHGTAVLSSNAACMSEVLGNEGIIYFKPDRTDDIVRAVETVLQNPMGVRVKAREVIPKLRERHDWRLAAERTLGAFEATVRRPLHAGRD